MLDSLYLLPLLARGRDRLETLGRVGGVESFALESPLLARGRDRLETLYPEIYEFQRSHLSPTR